MNANMVDLSWDVKPHTITNTPQSNMEKVTVNVNLRKLSSITYKNGSDVTKDKQHTTNIGNTTFFKYGNIGKYINSRAK